MWSNWSIKSKKKLAAVNQLKRSLVIFFLACAISIGINAHPWMQLGAKGNGALGQSPEPAALVRQSKEYYDRGQFDAATTALKQAVQIYQNNHNKLQEARTLSLLSLAYEQLGLIELADSSITDSLSLLEDLPATSAKNLVRAQILNRQGIWQLNRGQAEASITTLEDAERSYTLANDDRGIFVSKINQAQAWQTLGFFRRATAILDELTQKLQSQPASVIKLHSLNSLGDLFRQQGNLISSQRTLKQSLTIAKKLGLDSETSKVLFNLGNTNLSLANRANDTGAAELAQTYQNMALNDYQQAAELETLPLHKIQAELNQLGILIDNNRLAEAQALVETITQQLEILPPSRRAVYAQINFARSLMRMPPRTEQKPKITKIINRAIAQAKRLKDTRAESLSQGTLGRFYEVMGQVDLAKQYSNSALAIAQGTNATDLSYQWEWQLGRLLTQEEKNQAAIVAYTEAVNNLQLLRRDLIAIDRDVQFSFRKQVEPVYRQLVDLLLRSDNQQNLRQARQVIESLQLAQLENFFRSACLNAEPEQLDRIVESDPTTAVFYPIILPNRLEVIVKLPGRNQLRHYQSHRPQTEVRKTTTQLQQYLKEPDRTSDVKNLSQELYSWLIEPVAADLAANKVKTLIFVLDDDLRNIPMGVLYNAQQQQYLLEKYAIAVAPGLQLLDSKPLAGKRLNALIGGLEAGREIGGKEFSRLDNVSLELEQIQSQIAKGEQLLDKTFTQENLRDRLDNEEFSVIHLATHGQFSSQLEETFILTWDRLLKIGDLNDLLQLNNPQLNSIELLVLSACQTALGDERAALGLAGIAVRAGARSTLATLWSVDDLSTAKLMGEFYRQLAENQVSKAEALRLAQLQLWQEESQDWQRPYFWAAYTLVGNWL